MSVVSKNYTFSAGATIIAAEHNSNFDTIYNEFNGNIDNTNIKAGAGIVDTKLATIGTAGKVALSALPSGTGANQVFAFSTSTNLPPLTASNLTNLDATHLTIGLVPTAILGSGVANTATYLSGANTWSSIDLNKVSNVIFNHASISPWTVIYTTLDTVCCFRFLKTSSISTLVLHSRHSTYGSYTTASSFMSIGGITSSNARVLTQTLLAWSSSTGLNVSGLTNGTVYDGVILASSSNYRDGTIIVTG